MLAYFENASNKQLFEHFSRYGYASSDRIKSDICISTMDACGKLPPGKLFAAHENQKFYVDGVNVVYSFQSSIAGCVWGISSPPFVDVQIFCGNNGTENGCAVKAMLEVLQQFYRYRCLYLNRLLVHASAVVTPLGGVAFSGSSGAGKSTQANLWVKHRQAYYLNDDKPILSLEQDQIYISGSPWSGKGNCYLNETHKLQGMLFVEKAVENQLKFLAPREIYSLLYLNNMPVMLNEEIEYMFDQVIKLYVNRIPAYLLRCTPDIAAIDLVYNEIMEEGNAYAR